MNVSRLRDHCRALPGATEQIQWEDHLVFKVGGKMFCVASPQPDPPTALSFKCDPERFADLCERDGVIPAPYLARAQWVALERWDALEDAGILAAVTAAYEIVRAKLPKKVQAVLPGVAGTVAKGSAGRSRAGRQAPAGRGGRAAGTARGARR